MADGPSGQFEIGRVLANVWNVLRSGWQPVWPLLLVFVLAPQVVLAAIQLGLRPGLTASLREGALAYAGVTEALIGLMAIACGLVGFAGAISATYAAISFLNGGRITPREVLARTGQLYLPIVGLSLLVGLAVAAGLLLLIIPGLFLAVAWYAATPVRIWERTHVTDAIGRSYRLTESCRWPIAGVLLIVLCIYLILILVLGAAMVLLQLSGLGSWGGMVFTPLLQTVATMMGAAVSASVYHELIRIKEGGGATVADVFA